MTQKQTSATPGSEHFEGAKRFDGDVLKTKFPNVFARAASVEAHQRQGQEQLDHRRDQSARIERWKVLLGQIGIRYESATFDNFEVYAGKQAAAVQAVKDYARELTTHVGDCEGVVLFGPAGTGKDHLLSCLMKSAVLDHGLTLRWINGMDLFGAMRDGIEKGQDEARAIQQLTAPHILAISDPIPPWGPLTSFQAQVIFRVIDRRYRDRKPIWVTMNAAHGAEAAERLGASVVDRLRERAVAVHCDWPSYRLRNTKKS